MLVNSFIGMLGTKFDKSELVNVTTSYDVLLSMIHI